VSAYFSAISGKPSRFSIEALTGCSLLVFPYSHLEQLYRTSATWERFGRLLAEYIPTGLEDRRQELLMPRPEERYAHQLTGSHDTSKSKPHQKTYDDKTGLRAFIIYC